LLTVILAAKVIAPRSWNDMLRLGRR
jgi:hypothetical protein